MEGITEALTIFVLALFVGYEVITKVPPILHTPLMSGSNAISGITVLGALLFAGLSEGLLHGGEGFCLQSRLVYLQSRLVGLLSLLHPLYRRMIY